MATDSARGKVIHEKQPFGFVRNHNMMGPGMNGIPTKNRMAPDTMVQNRGLSAKISDADKNPGAYEQACKNRDNPFAWTGMPMPSSHNSYNARMNQTEDVS